MAAVTDSSSDSLEYVVDDERNYEDGGDEASKQSTNNSTSQSQEASRSSISNGSGTASGDKPEQRPPCQPMKRRPDKDLNHDNWDQEEEAEDKGEFRKANEEQLKERKILTAKRKQKLGTEASSNPFASLNLPSAPANTGAKPAFSFNFSRDSTPQAPVPSFDFSCVGSNQTEKSNGPSSNSASPPTVTKEKENPMDNDGDGTAIKPVPTKRRPATDLNHDNWDQEEEPEEKGEFKKASEDQLKDRKILTAKRKQKPSETSNNPFGSLSLASSFGTGTGGPASMFNFGAPTSTSVPSFDFSSTSAAVNKASSDTKDDKTNP